MDAGKLKQIIAGKNQDRERNIAARASALIDELVRQQAIITQANNEITEIQKELKTLEVETIDDSILGT